MQTRGCMGSEERVYGEDACMRRVYGEVEWGGFTGRLRVHIGWQVRIDVISQQNPTLLAIIAGEGWTSCLHVEPNLAGHHMEYSYTRTDTMVCDVWVHPRYIAELSAPQVHTEFLEGLSAVL